MIVYKEGLSAEDIFNAADSIMRMGNEVCFLRKPRKEDIIDYIIGHLDNEDYWICAYKENNVILGGAGLFFMPFLWNKNHIRAMETFLHADPDLPKAKKTRIMIALIEEIEKECRRREVDSLTIGTIVFNELDRYLEKKNYKLAEKLYIKEI